MSIILYILKLYDIIEIIKYFGVNLMKLNDLLDMLKSNGYRITEQRKAIAQVLASNHDNLISVENLFNKSKEFYSKTNMSTAYRNLEILENLNLV